MGAASPAAASPRPAVAAPWAACQAAASILHRCRPRRPPRPQLSRSRHANFWLGTKGSARAGWGRALLPRAAQPARPPLTGSAGLAGGSPPPSRAAPPRPGSPPGSPGARSGAQGRRAEAEPGRGQGKGATGAEREEAAERIGGRGSEGGASAGFQAREPRRQPPGSNPRPPRPGLQGKPRPREGERRGAVPRESQPRGANPLTKESPALLPPARPPVAPAVSQPAPLGAQPKDE